MRRDHTALFFCARIALRQTFSPRRSVQAIRGLRLCGGVHNPNAVVSSEGSSPGSRPGP